MNGIVRSEIGSDGGETEECESDGCQNTAQYIVQIPHYGVVEDSVKMCGPCSEKPGTDHSGGEDS